MLTVSKVPQAMRLYELSANYASKLTMTVFCQKMPPFLARMSPSTREVPSHITKYASRLLENSMVTHGNGDAFSILAICSIVPSMMTTGTGKQDSTLISLRHSNQTVRTPRTMGSGW